MVSFFLYIKAQAGLGHWSVKSSTSQAVALPSQGGCCLCVHSPGVVVQLLSHVQLSATPWTAARQAPLTSAILQNLLKIMSIETVMLSNHLNLCCPLLLYLHSFPTPGPFPMTHFFASSGQIIGASGSASALVLPVNIQGWFPLGLTDLTSLQSKGLSSLFQHHNLKASVLWHSGFMTIHD